MNIGSETAAFEADLPLEMVLEVAVRSDIPTQIMLRCTCRALCGEVVITDLVCDEQTRADRMLMEFLGGSPGDFPPTKVWKCSFVTLLLRRGYIELAKWAVEEAHFGIDTSAFVCSASHNNIKILSWLYECLSDNNYPIIYAPSSALSRYSDNSYPMNVLVPAMAAAYGHIGVLEWWFHEKGLPFDRAIVAAAAAAARGQLDVLIWLWEHKDFSFDNNLVATFAGFYGHIRILDWLQGQVLDVTSASTFAAAGGQIHVLEWLDSCGYTIDNDAGYAAAKCGQRDALIWLNANGYYWNSYIVMEAVSFGHAELAKWLLLQGCPYDSEVAIVALNRPKNVDFVRWLHAQGYQLRDDILCAAVTCENITFLDWLYSIGFRPNSEALLAAVSLVQPAQSVVRWLREHRCDYTEETYAYASVYQGDNVDFLQWLLEDGCPCTPRTRQLLSELQAQFTEMTNWNPLQLQQVNENVV